MKPTDVKTMRDSERHRERERESEGGRGREREGEGGKGREKPLGRQGTPGNQAGLEKSPLQHRDGLAVRLSSFRVSAKSGTSTC